MAGSGTAHLRDSDDMVIRVENLTVEFPAKGGNVVMFTVYGLFNILSDV